MSDSLIPSFLVSDVRESLRSLTKNERCEWIPQVVHQKWATISDSLRSLNKMSEHERIAQVAHQKRANERIANFFERIAHSLIFGQKTSDSLGKPMSIISVCYWSVQKVESTRKIDSKLLGKLWLKDNDGWIAYFLYAQKVLKKCPC